MNKKRWTVCAVLGWSLCLLAVPARAQTNPTTQAPTNLPPITVTRRTPRRTAAT